MDLIYFSENIQYYGQDVTTLLTYVYIANFINWYVFKGVFLFLGIHPRKLIGLIGIFLAPILHASTDHFLLNAIPFFCMTFMMILIFDFEIAQILLQALAVFSGILIWIFARPGIHVGASALVSAMYGWLLYWTFHHPSFLNFSILMTLFIYFSSILTGLVPNDPKISWEGHVLGFCSGIATARWPQWLEYFVTVKNEALDFFDYLI